MEKIVKFGVGLLTGVALISLDKRYRSHALQTFVVDREKYKKDCYPRWILWIICRRYLTITTDLHEFNYDSHSFDEPIKGHKSITFEKRRNSLFYRWWGTSSG